MVTNYPSGHPSGVAIDVNSFGYVICEHCLVVEERNREVEPLPKCKHCKRYMEVLLCDKCNEEAMYEVNERDVNAASHFCKGHLR